MPPDALQAHAPIDEVIGYRDAAIKAANEACALLEQGFAKANEAKAFAIKASGGHTAWAGHRESAHYRILLSDFKGQASFDAMRAATDADVWLRLYHDTGMYALMDSDARKALTAELTQAVPEVTLESAYERLSAVHEDRAMIFRRGLANSFIRLDRRFKSHDPYQFDRRVILTNLFDCHGYSRDTHALDDIERAFAVLDRRLDYKAGTIRAKIRDERYGQHGARQSVHTSEYFKIRVYKNGNGHLWFTREDLVERVNQELAAYYGAVLPDGVPTPEQDLHRKASTTAVSKDLAFYPTPRKVIDEILKSGLAYQLEQNPQAKILEPSAGDGAIVRVLLGLSPNVTAIEVDPDRYRKLAGLQARHPGLTALCSNFLGLSARPAFDVVVMNPPFCGTHYAAHVMHAYDFLKPRGVLYTILPATAQYSDHGDHAKFQAWAAHHKARFTDLPDESFKESGTRIHTCYMTLTKPR